MAREGAAMLDVGGQSTRPGHEPMLRFNCLVLPCCALDFVGGSFSPLLPDPIQLSPFLLHTLSGGERQF